MKYLVFIPFAVLLGLTAGSWAPRSELTELRLANRQLKKELESSGKTGKLAALNSIMKIPDGTRSGRNSHASSPQPDNLTEDGEPIAENTANAQTNLTAKATAETADASGRHRRRRLMPNPRSNNFEAELEEAKELWKTRVAMARSQWLAKLELDEAQSELFDNAFAEMNERLYLTMQIVADELKSGSEMTHEAGLRVVNEVTTTLVETYDQLDLVVSPDRRPELETMEMQDFIDPMAFEPLVDVRDKL
jgi:hypothetical protein